ncbi:MAG: hypothetical protein ACRBB5_02135 [Nitrosopumilus sp.]
MKVVGAKLDEYDYERFETFCLDESLSKSEILRYMIREYCDACDAALRIESNDKKLTVTIIDENSPSELQNVTIRDD